MKVKLILLMIVLLISSSLVLAQDYGYSDPEIYDSGSDYYDENIYSYAESYLNDDFYMMSDPLSWDLSQVDWSNSNLWQNEQAVDLFARDDLYSYPDFYVSFGEIPTENYGDIDWNQFDYSNPDFDFEDMGSEGWEANRNNEDFQNAIANNENGALDKYVATYLGADQKLDLGQTEGLTFVGDVLITDRSRGIIRFTDFPDAKGFQVTGRGDVRVIYDEEASIPTEISDGSRMDFAFPSGAEISGAKVSRGSILKYDDGEWLVPNGRTVNINGLEITSKIDVPIYGLGDDEISQALRTHERNGEYYALSEKLYGGGGGGYIGENTFALSRDCSSCEGIDLRTSEVTIDVQSGNTYGIPVRPAGYEDTGGHVQRYDDSLTISANDGTFVWVEETAQNPAGAEVYGHVSVENGYREVQVVDGAVYSKAEVYRSSVNKGSVPINLELYDNGGNPPEGFSNTFSFGNDHELIVSSGEQEEVAHFSIVVDPYNLLGESAAQGANVLSNIEKSDFKIPFLAISTPGNSAEEELFEITTDLTKNLDSRYVPMELNLEDVGDKSTLAYTNLMKGFDRNNRETDLNELETVPKLIFGHSNAVSWVDTDGNPKKGFSSQVSESGTTYYTEDSELGNSFVGCSEAVIYAETQLANSVIDARDNFKTNILSPNENINSYHYDKDNDCISSGNGCYDIVLQQTDAGIRTRFNPLNDEMAQAIVPSLQEDLKGHDYFNVEFKNDDEGNPTFNLEHASLKHEALLPYAAIEIYKLNHPEDTRSIINDDHRDALLVEANNELISSYSCSKIREFTSFDILDCG